MDTAVTKKGDFNNSTNITKILKPFSSRKSTDRPSVDQLSKKGYLGSNAKKKKKNSKQNFVTFQSVQEHRCKNPKNLFLNKFKCKFIKE